MDTLGKKKAARKRGKEKPYLPDEIITNILIWLPVKSLLRFQLVSKNWRDEISSRDFVDLHHRSSNPLVLVASTKGSSFKLSAIDKWCYSVRKRSVIHKFPSCAPDYPNASMKPISHYGLIVLNGSRFSEPVPTLIILNPARPSDECVNIRYSNDFQGDILAVYYHPILKEYCALWRICIASVSGFETKQIQYKLLTLGSNPSFRKISDQFIYRVKHSSSQYPLLIKDRLYWMLESEQIYYTGHNDILEFDIISEQFMVIPCPLPSSTECKWHQTHLLNSDGFLSFLLILSSTITIWALKDRELQLWTTTEYTINLSKCLMDYIAHISAFVNGMLAYHYGGTLFVCNLREGTVKTYPKKYGGHVLFLSHQMSLASLKKCKAELYIDKDGEVFVQ